MNTSNIAPWEGPDELSAEAPPPAAPPAKKAFVLTKDQDAALSDIRAWMSDPKTRLMVVKGPAGTGKSTLMERVLAEFPLIIPTALSNKAARVLTRALNMTTRAKTIYSALGLIMEADEDQVVLKKSEYADPVPYGSVLLVDEAFMMNTVVLRELWKQARERNLKVLLVGDNFQLNPVGETDPPVDSIDCPTAVLRKVVRFDNSLLTLTKELRRRIAERNFTIDGLFEETDDIAVLNGEQFHLQMIRAFQSAHTKHFENIDRVRCVAWTNRRVQDYNASLRAALGIDTSRPYSPGDLLMAASPVCTFEKASMYGTERVKKTIVSTIDDEFRVVKVKEVDLPNVDFFTHKKSIEVYEIDVIGDYKGKLIIPVSTAEVDDELSRLADKARLAGRQNDRKAAKAMWKTFWETKERFNQVRHGWAITSHRAQGSTYDFTFVDVPNILRNQNREEAFRSLYVSCSRPRQRLIVTL